MNYRSPFTTLLEGLATQAGTEPLAAFGRLQEAYKALLTDEDVRTLCGFAANLGGAVLGRWDDVLTFLETLLEHPAVEAGGETEHSIQRAMGVMQRCAGRFDRADALLAKGVRDAADRARVEILTAQMLAARSRIREAVPYLEASAKAFAEVPVDDELIQQGAMIALNIQRAAEQQIDTFRTVLLAATHAQKSALMRSPDWRTVHKACFHAANAEILAGRPREALAQVQEMMALEDEHDASPGERFFTASLACRAQLLRGQMRVAHSAFEACRDYAGRVDSSLKDQVGRALADLTALMEQGNAG